MEENKYTDLDHLFRNRIANANDAKQAWNTPPDSVFLSAMNTLDEQKKKRRKAFVLWFAFISIVLLLSSVILLNQLNIRKMNQKMDLLIQQQAMQTKDEALKVDPDNVQSNALSNKLENSAIPVQKTSTQDDSVEASPKQLSKVTANLTNKADVKNIPPVVESFVKISPENTLNISAQRNPIKQLHKLNQKINELAFERQFNPAFPALLLNHRVPSPNKVNSIEFFGGMTSSSFTMQGKKKDKKTLKEYDQWYPSYHFGLEFNRHLSDRFSLGLGLAYQNSRNQSSYHSDMRFDPLDQKLNALGELMYEPMVFFDSPLGSVNRAISVNIENNPIENNEALDYQAKISNSLHILSANTHLNYKLIQSKKLDFFISMGFATQYIAYVSQEMDMEMYYKSEMLFQDRFESPLKDQLNPFVFSLTGGAKLQYNINDNYSLGLKLEYQHSLNSLRQMNANQKISTQLRTISSGISLGYRF